MNGRVQDAITGRFLSPDPNVTDPAFTQSFNRYSYVNNNPLSFVDPSGFDTVEIEVMGNRITSQSWYMDKRIVLDPAAYAIAVSYGGSEMGGYAQVPAELSASSAAPSSSVLQTLVMEAQRIVSKAEPILRHLPFYDLGQCGDRVIAGSGCSAGQWFGAGVSGTLDAELFLVAGPAGTEGAAAARVLSEAQAANLGRFLKRLPSSSRSSATVRDLPGGGKVFQGEVPGRVPGSRAVYEKQIDAAGNTTQLTKTTYDPAGNIADVADKLTMEKFIP
jgi:hypothetical protein